MVPGCLISICSKASGNWKVFPLAWQSWSSRHPENVHLSPVSFRLYNSEHILMLLLIFVLVKDKEKKILERLSFTWYSYFLYRECIRKFGERLGVNVWNAVNEVFDCMPVAAIVDKKVCFSFTIVCKKTGLVDRLLKQHNIYIYTFVYSFHAECNYLVKELIAISTGNHGSNLRP